MSESFTMYSPQLGADVSTRQPVGGLPRKCFFIKTLRDVSFFGKRRKNGTIEPEIVA